MGVCRICNIGGFEILWCEYLWVVTHPVSGGMGVLPQENLENMKCSRNDSRPIFHKESKKKIITTLYLQLNYS